MPGRVNHRGWTVLVSVPSSDHGYCVDIFARADGSLGFEQFRSEPEDAGSWMPVSGTSDARFDTRAAVATAVRDSVAWIRHDQQGLEILDDWVEAAAPSDVAKRYS